MIIGYIVTATIFMLGIVAAYVLEFIFNPGYVIVPDTSVWGNFGSYVGGLAGPALSFLSLIFLVRTFKLQFEQNEALKIEVKRNKKSEELRDFSDLFFNLIDSQRALLENFKLDFVVNGTSSILSGVSAIQRIEADIHALRGVGASDRDIKRYLDGIDPEDQIYGVVRAFYISVKMIAEKLSNVREFSVAERNDFLNTLINFTDFAQLRLILMTMQFVRIPPAQYLRDNLELISVLKEVGLKLDPY